MNYEKYFRKRTPVIFIRVKALLQHASLYIGRRPRLKRAAKKVLRHFPNTKARLTQAILLQTAQLDQSHHMRANVAQLTPHASQIYADLKAAIEDQQKVLG